MFGFLITIAAMIVFVVAIVIGCYINYDKDGKPRRQ